MATKKSTQLFVVLVHNQHLSFFFFSFDCRLYIKLNSINYLSCTLHVVGTAREKQMNVNYEDQGVNGPNMHTHSESINMVDSDYDLNKYQTVTRKHNRKRRNDYVDQEVSPNSSNTPKRKITEQVRIFSSEKQNSRGTTATSTTSSYFNLNRPFNKQIYESSVYKQTNETSNRKQYQRESFPPFRIVQRQ